MKDPHKFQARLPLFVEVQQMVLVLETVVTVEHQNIIAWTGCLRMMALMPVHLGHKIHHGMKYLNTSTVTCMLPVSRTGYLYSLQSVQTSPAAAAMSNKIGSGLNWKDSSQISSPSCKSSSHLIPNSRYTITTDYYTTFIIRLSNSSYTPNTQDTVNITRGFAWLLKWSACTCIYGYANSNTVVPEVHSGSCGYSDSFCSCCFYTHSQVVGPFYTQFIFGM